MIRLRRSKPQDERDDSRLRTSMSFSADDLKALAHLVAAGQVLLQTRHPVVARLKAALSRLKLSAPQGL